MILRLTTLHENGLVGAKSSVFNKSSGYFHGSEESRSGRFLCDAPKQSEIPPLRSALSRNDTVG